VSAQPAIEVSGLRVIRGEREVLPGIDVAVERGKVTGLLGPSGAGKTTLIRAIVGVQIVAGGEVRVLGEPAGSPALRGAGAVGHSRLGYVTQAPSVYGDLSVEENLRYFAQILGATRERVAEVIEDVQLSDHADQVVRNLSGGQRARVSLGTALLGQPELLVLDEPTVGLDPVLRARLWENFRGLAAAGTTLLISSHVMDEAGHCDELLLMREGRIVATGSPQGLLERTGTDNLDDAFLRVVEGSEGEG
jgi:ABC-2 type transport system ATP-binding protein